ncbi:hypothetical protein [Cupriavidus basilensis]|uniref:hypothetical protein n=1 Tax=Cupriavidus basilensis TaxID=68895 RepID=UPI0023E8E7B4|nr:hypothetical protein [Cupriavidus basilensis]MDF3885024.1 hypothetical protein [Cupriavidus basilensis]
MSMQISPADSIGDTTETHLPGWAYSTLAIITGAAGIAAAAITARFFILGMERLEPDLSARQVLTAAGILMIAVELLAFGVAALLPRKAMRAMRFKLIVLGLCLLIFEAGTLFVTQVAMVRVGQAASQGESTRITALRASIASQRQAAATLRATAERQAESRSEWVRNMAAKQATQALTVEAGIATQAAELAQLEAAMRPTLDNVLGDQGMVFYALCRSLLIVVMSVVLLAVSGGLLRARYSLTATRKADAPKRLWQTKPARLPEADALQAASLFPAAPHIAPEAPQSIVSEALAAMQACSPVEPAGTAPTMMRQADALDADAGNAVERTALQNSGTSNDDGSRFQRVRADILAGKVKPSLPAIYAAHGATQELARRYLAEMVATGDVMRVGKRYVLSTA